MKVSQFTLCLIQYRLEACFAQPPLHTAYTVIIYLFCFVFLAMNNWKVQADIQDRRQFDEEQFRQAGQGRPKRTYKFDPTKPRIKARQ